MMTPRDGGSNSTSNPSSSNCGKRDSSWRKAMTREEEIAAEVQRIRALPDDEQIAGVVVRFEALPQDRREH